VGSLYFQLAVLATSLRHPPGSMISPSHWFSAGRPRRYGRVIRIQSQEPLLLSPADAAFDRREAKSHMKCRMGLVHSQHLRYYRSQGADSGRPL
jgi:hypothetical protein